MIRFPIRLYILHGVLFLSILFSPAGIYGRSFTVKSVQEYQNAESRASAGDTIVWEKGIYRDIRWIVKKDSIHIRAEQPGATVFTGNSSVEITASSICFTGFQFAGGKTGGDICKISGSHNRIEHLNFTAYHSKYYLHVTQESQYNTIRYCNFERKPEDIESSVVQIQVSGKQPGYHVISWCSFLNHTAPYHAGGDYGIEALRIGYSFQAKFISRTTVEYCYFSRCNGDGEVISSKACENVYRYNTFENNGESHFTLRHGSDNVVYGNFFFGAGIRIKEGQNHMVYNNYFKTGEYWAVKLENYKADPLRNIVIAHNTFENSGALKLGGKGEFKPAQVIISGNLFWNPSQGIIEDQVGSEIFQGNRIPAGYLDGLPKGFLPFKGKMMMNSLGFIQPAKRQKTERIEILDIPAINDDPALVYDISLNKRATQKKSAGCFEPTGRPSQIIPYATALNTGPEYLQIKAALAGLVSSEVRQRTLEKAGKMMFEKPVTVTASTCVRSAGGRHDFFSEGDYWWPDPANPEGPYIQKDGQSNPGIFSDHRHAIIRLSEITATLTSAYMLTGNRNYASRATEHLCAWFVDSSTLMNPHMLYAQAIYGRHTGRGIGLIDAYHFVEVIQSVRILINDRVIPLEKAEKIQNWFSAFLEWMTTHPYGIDEMNAKNNHGTCWVATAAAIAVLTGNEPVRQLCINRFKEVLLPGQMAPDGSFPLELRRTKPYGYSLFNIDAMCTVARLLSSPQENLWEYRTSQGLSLRTGMEFIFPYIREKEKWPFNHDIYIFEEWPVRQSCLLFSGLAYNNSDFITQFTTLPDNPVHAEVIRNLPVRHPVIWLRNTYN